MEVREIGIIMNGVTGRMGTNQHLLRSLIPIIQEGGVATSQGQRLIPKLLLVGRNPAKLSRLSEMANCEYTTDLAEALDRTDFEIYFDAQITGRRVEAVRKAISAGKHVYIEKPSAENLKDAYDLYSMAKESGIIHGVVQDKLWLPGFKKFQTLKQSGFLGDIISVRGEFGYWVFEGDRVSSQRPAWNYRKEDGGGIILDMLSHWRYLLDNLFGEVRAVSCLGKTHIHHRWDENGKPYEATADDAAYAMFELENDVVATINSSWCVRVRRDDLVSFQVDGTQGSAVIGLRDVWTQSYAQTPRPVWNPDQENPIDFRESWSKLPNQTTFENAFKAQWKLFLRHVGEGIAFPNDLLEGAKGVQLAEIGMKSWQERSWKVVKELER